MNAAFFIAVDISNSSTLEASSFSGYIMPILNFNTLS